MRKRTYVVKVEVEAWEEDDALYQVWSPFAMMNRPALVLKAKLKRKQCC